MAEAYKIIIESSGGGTGKKSNIAGNSTTQKSTTQESEAISKGNVAGYVAYKKYGAPLVSQAVQYQIGTVAIRKGSNERQARAQSMYSVATQVFSIGESAVMGAMVGGPFGALAGALVGTVNSAIGLAYKQNTIDLNRSVENQTISMLQERSGAVNGNRR